MLIGTLILFKSLRVSKDKETRLDYVTHKVPKVEMQFSSNRVNFTTSVAHYNYAKLLSKSQTARKRVQDIVTILGLHTDDPAPFTPSAQKVNCCYFDIECSKKNSALVLYLTKTLKYRDKIMSWLKFKTIVYSEYLNMEIEFDMKTRTSTVFFCCDERKFYWVLHITYLEAYNDVMLRKFYNSKFIYLCVGFYRTL